MIAYLEGMVRNGGDGWIILLVSGVGYRVYPVGTMPVVGKEMSFFVYDYIREDRRELYGFLSQELLMLFEQLIDVSGVGPRLAQKILSAGTEERISKEILNENIEYLTSIPGVGKKTAQKIILELKGSLVMKGNEQGEDAELLDALQSLGYRKADIAPILKQLDGETVEGRIRQALQLLSR